MDLRFVCWESGCHPESLEYAPATITMTVLRVIIGPFWKEFYCPWVSGSIPLSLLSTTEVVQIIVPNNRRKLNNLRSFGVVLNLGSIWKFLLKIFT